MMKEFHNLRVTAYSSSLLTTSVLLCYEVGVTYDWELFSTLQLQKQTVSCLF